MCLYIQTALIYLSLLVINHAWKKTIIKQLWLTLRSGPDDLQDIKSGLLITLVTSLYTEINAWHKSRRVLLNSFASQINSTITNDDYQV